MRKDASLTVRVKPETRTRLEEMARATKRSKSFIIEEALEDYLDVNAWQIEGIHQSLTEADSATAEWLDHDEVAGRARGKGCKLNGCGAPFSISTKLKCSKLGSWSCREIPIWSPMMAVCRSCASTMAPDGGPISCDTL
jgi:RHH-type transcriptional regulator, rel operon repressor / antitoxin RelB